MFQKYMLNLMYHLNLISKSKYLKKTKKLTSDYALLKKSKLFNSKWYLNSYPDVKAAKCDPISHYLNHGWKEGRNPSPHFNTNAYLAQHPDCKSCPLLFVHRNRFDELKKSLMGKCAWRNRRKKSGDLKTISKSIYFDAQWYLKQNPDVKKAHISPAEHYLVQGWREGRNPSPYFDTMEYLTQNPDVAAAAMNPLLHYELAGKMEKRTGGISNYIQDYHCIKNSKYFDIKYYKKHNPDVVACKVDPVEHYLTQGWREGRMPSKLFQDIQPYSPKNKNPVLYLEKYGINSAQNEYIDWMLSMYSDKSHFVPKIQVQSEFDTDLRLIAFYLPQYHLFPENEEWHGLGFTEWSNVTKTIPYFVGHRQPQLPIDVGFYDLANIDVMKRQTELAKLYGLNGFCFHYYWFSGKRLMEKPIYNYLKHTEIDFPFCLCWANENWSKLWDGGNKEVLMKQELKDGDDEKFAKDIIPFFLDKRYIRIHDKPLFIVYRPALFDRQRFCRFVNILKKECRKAGISDIFILASNSFGFNQNPSKWNLNGIVEFPPNNMHVNAINQDLISNQAKITIMDAANFICKKEYLYDTDYPLFKTVFPSWDNTARKAFTGATCFYGETPDLYYRWLKNCIDWTTDHHVSQERFVFINAWNEWAEGAHLEPDHYYGYAYLDETRRAVLDVSRNVRRIIYVGHNACYNGAQLLTLNILKTLRCHYRCEIELILLEGGELTSEYAQYAHVTILNNMNEEAKLDFIRQLKSRGFHNAITNTIIMGSVTEYLAKNDIRMVSLIHELPKIIAYYHAEQAGESLTKYADKIVFASTYVRDAFNQLFTPDKEKLQIIPQGLYKPNPLAKKNISARSDLRKDLGLPSNARIVLLVGYGNKRKGIDLYLDVMDLVTKRDKNTYFVLVGEIDEAVIAEKQALINRHPDRIIFCGKQMDTSKYYAGSDLFLLTSREDPFPSVVMEAFECGLPVIGFKDAGGFADIVDDTTGGLVPYEDTAAMAKLCLKLLNDPKRLKQIAHTTRALVAEKFYWNTYVGRLLNLSESLVKKVSVIVPNYNYARYLEQRLDSIINQTYPIYELIVLDDCSTDSSLKILQNYKNNKYPNMKIITNNKNSGSVFNQWAKGIEAASGDYIWIAEADDLSERGFLSECMKNFSDPNVVLSYTQSQIIDENGKKTADNYLFWTNDISENKWQTDYIVDGTEEIATALCVKNTIPNVSAVVFKKFDIRQYLNDIRTYKVAGDLFLYLQLLKSGKIGFCAEALNKHRRHSGSVTVSRENNQKHFDEIVALQDLATQMVGPQPDILTKIKTYRKTVKTYLLGGKK